MSALLRRRSVEKEVKKIQNTLGSLGGKEDSPRGNFETAARVLPKRKSVQEKYQKRVSKKEARSF